MKDSSRISQRRENSWRIGCEELGYCASVRLFCRKNCAGSVHGPWRPENVVPPDRVGGRSLEDFYDNSVLQELVNEGFLTKDAKQKK
jgi:hypothetical protein